MKILFLNEITCLLCHSQFCGVQPNIIHTTIIKYEIHLRQPIMFPLVFFLFPSEHNFISKGCVRFISLNTMPASSDCNSSALTLFWMGSGRTLYWTGGKKPPRLTLEYSIGQELFRTTKKISDVISIVRI